MSHYHVKHRRNLMMKPNIVRFGTTEVLQWKEPLLPPLLLLLSILLSPRLSFSLLRKFHRLLPLTICRPRFADSSFFSFLSALHPPNLVSVFPPLCLSLFTSFSRFELTVSSDSRLWAAGARGRVDRG